MKGNSMKKILTIAIAIAVFSLFIGITEAQQGMQSRRGMGMGKGMNQAYRMFDSKTIENISGEVISIDNSTGVKGNNIGVHLTLKTDKETISVHLGPSWFIDKQDVKIQAKDKIEIKSSRIIYQGKPTIVAMYVNKGGKSIKLRDENGKPVWSGRNK
jgi:hypothetical protein